MVYMDGTFEVLRQSITNIAHVDFAAGLSEVDSYLFFTFEIEENSRLPFLNILLMKEPDGSLSSTVYRKDSNIGQTINP